MYNIISRVKVYKRINNLACTFLTEEGILFFLPNISFSWTAMIFMPGRTKPEDIEPEITLMSKSFNIFSILTFCESEDEKR